MKLGFDYEHEEEAEKSRQWYNPLIKIGQTMLACGVYVFSRFTKSRTNPNKLETITK